MSKRLALYLTVFGVAGLAVLAAKTVPALSADPEPAKAARADEAVPSAPTANIKTAASRATAVTVYPNSALVTREVDVPEGPGTIELVVTPLPPATIDSSLYSEGTEGIRVLSTRFRTRPILEDTREDVRKLQDELRMLQFNKEKVDADIKAIQANIHLLTKLENFTSATTVQATEKGNLNSESAIALSKYVMESRAEKSREQISLQQQVQLIQEKIEFAQRKLRELAASPARTERDAVIVVEKQNAAAGKVRLNYLVESASWRPQYKLRAGKASTDPVQIEYLAALLQHTGEDWTGVKLVLSTAQPTLNAAPPDLQVLQVRVVPRGNNAATAQAPGVMEVEERVRMLRSQAQKDFNERKQSSGVGLFNTAAALDQSFELLNPDAAVKRGCALAFREGPSVTYHLNTRLSVPSRNDEQVIEVARLDLAPDYYYKAVPVLTPHVYRLADLTNKSNYVLLPGEATMYIGTDFVGQMNLPLVAIGETFTAGFGVDPQLQVQRLMVDRSRATQGGNQVLRYDFRILVSSYKSEKVKLQVWDRLPHAENDTVGVSLMRTLPDLSKDAIYQREQRPNNLLRWDVAVEPTMSGEKALAIDYDFKLELDRQMSIGSFQTAGVSSPALPTLTSITSIPGVSSADEAKIKANLAKLSPEDRKLAEAQVFCAIDQDSPLGSMGPVFKVMAKERPVFVCCKGCEAEVKAHPDQTIAKLDQMLTRLRANPPRR